jgi:hypothetical protein
MSYSSVWISAPAATLAKTSGLIVACLTFASICATTSPPRWMIPRIGGFSFSSVPRLRAAFSRLRRPARPFFERRRVSLVARVNIDLVDLDFARQDHGRRFGREPLA